jgi:protein-tyrosine-phosphatase
MSIIFMCQHGGAKSVIAAAYLRAAGFEAEAVSAEDPYDAVPAPVVELLKDEGFDVSAFKPRRVERTDIETAQRVIAIDCPVIPSEVEGPGGAGGAPPDPSGSPIERWDVPKLSDDLHASVAAIRRHVDALIAELRG